MTEATTIHMETNVLQVATFYVGDLLLGIPIQQVQEINRQLDLIPVPHAPSHLRGVINLRGEVVSVIDLCTVLGVESQKLLRSTRNLIIQDQDQLVGLIVDDVADIVSVETSEIRQPPANFKGVSGKFFRGVCTTPSEIIVILNLEETLG